MCKRLTRFCSKSYDEMIFRMKTDTLRDVQLFGIWQKMPFFIVTILLIYLKIVLT